MKRLVPLMILFSFALSGCMRPGGQERPPASSGPAPSPPASSLFSPAPSRIPQDAGEAGPVIKQGKRLYIGLPQNAVHGGRAIPGSGAEVSRLFAKHCKNDAKSVVVAENPISGDADMGDVLGEIRKTGADYAIIPEIAHWETRGANRPVCVLAVAVYDVKTGELLADEPVSTNDPALADISDSGNALLEDAIYRFLTRAFSGE